MARTVRNPKLDSRSARSNLKPRREPYWCAMAPGRHLGYRRIGREGGTWIAKLRTPATGRRYHALGAADDALDADGDTVLTFAQAQEKGRAWFAGQERLAAGENGAEADPPAAPQTVADAAVAYLDWFQLHRKSLYDTRRAIEALGATVVVDVLGGALGSALTWARIFERSARRGRIPEPVGISIPDIPVNPNCRK